MNNEDVKDLQAGDVVEIRQRGWPEGTVVRGPLYKPPSSRAGLYVSTLCVRDSDGIACQGGPLWELTVVSRVPRSVYTNVERTRYEQGDVVRDADQDDGPQTWSYADKPDHEWRRLWRTPGDGQLWAGRDELPARLRLLVNGNTGLPPTS